MSKHLEFALNEIVKLERENAELRTDGQRWQNEHLRLLAENAELLAANAELITVGAEQSATADELRAENAELRAEARTADGIKWSEISEMWRHKFEAAEREIADLKRTCGELTVDSNAVSLAQSVQRLEARKFELYVKLTEAEATIAELRADKARLDWLDSCGDVCSDLTGKYNWKEWLVSTINSSMKLDASIRSAIDSEMKLTKEENDN
jgi:hypothetical protein